MAQASSFWSFRQWIAKVREGRAYRSRNCAHYDEEGEANTVRGYCPTATTQEVQNEWEVSKKSSRPTPGNHSLQQRPYLLEASQSSQMARPTEYGVFKHLNLWGTSHFQNTVCDSFIFNVASQGNHFWRHFEGFEFQFHPAPGAVDSGIRWFLFPHAQAGSPLRWDSILTEEVCSRGHSHVCTIALMVQGMHLLSLELDWTTRIWLSAQTAQAMMLNKLHINCFVSAGFDAVMRSFWVFSVENNITHPAVVFLERAKLCHIK